jgi:hypothetical protein
MVTHILLWNYRSEVPDAERRAIEAELLALPGRVPSLAGLTFGPVFRWRVREYSHACVMLFPDEAALVDYQFHPAHKAFAARFHPATAELVAIDYESEDTGA